MEHSVHCTSESSDLDPCYLLQSRHRNHFINLSCSILRTLWMVARFLRFFSSIWRRETLFKLAFNIYSQKAVPFGFLAGNHFLSSSLRAALTHNSSQHQNSLASLIQTSLYQREQANLFQISPSMTGSLCSSEWPSSACMAAGIHLFVVLFGVLFVGFWFFFLTRCPRLHSVFQRGCNRLHTC